MSRCRAAAKAVAWRGVTLSQGIAVTVTDAVEEIREVVDVTDHVLGTRPYFEPGRVSTVPQSP